MRNSLTKGLIKQAGFKPRVTETLFPCIMSPGKRVAAVYCVFSEQHRWTCFFKAIAPISCLYLTLETEALTGNACPKGKAKAGNNTTAGYTLGRQPTGNKPPGLHSKELGFTWRQEIIPPAISPANPSTRRSTYECK